MSRYAISIVILTYKRTSLFRRCLDSIFKALGNMDLEYELCIAVNGSDPETEAYLKEKDIEFLSFSAERRVGDARNELIRSAQGKYLCFLDDDLEIPENYFKLALEFLKKDLDVFGGPDQSPKVRNQFQEALNNVMRSYWAMGPTKNRHTTSTHKLDADESNLILCNLWIKREIFSRYKFPTHYVRNEENLLLYQLKRDGFIFGYVNELIVYHHRKESLLSLSRATFYSGRYRLISVLDEPGIFRFVYFVPLLCLFILILSAVLNSKLFCMLLSSYLLFITSNSFWVNRKNISPELVLNGILIFIIYNFVYPIGMLSCAWRKKRE